MQRVHVENSEFDRSGSDLITVFFAGLIGVPLFVIALVWVASLF